MSYEFSAGFGLCELERRLDRMERILAQIATNTASTAAAFSPAPCVGPDVPPTEGTTFRMLGEDVERMLTEPKPTPLETKGPKVEILFNGCRRVILVDGRRIPKVLNIETPRDQCSLAGVVNVSFVASEIVEREVSQEQFAALLRGEAGG